MCKDYVTNYVSNPAQHGNVLVGGITLHLAEAHVAQLDTAPMTGAVLVHTEAVQPRAS